MSNNVAHYFGAYLEIKVRPKQIKKSFYACENGHRGTTNFCGVCGKPVSKEIAIVEEMPIFLDDLVYNDESLSIATPPSLFRTGTIIAIGNKTAVTGDVWLYLQGDDAIEIEAFPTDEEIEAMEIAFFTGYANTISAIRKSPHVISAEIKSGYVLNAEY